MKRIYIITVIIIIFVVCVDLIDSCRRIDQTILNDSVKNTVHKAFYVKK